MQMATQRRDTMVAGVYHPLMFRSLYSGEGVNFVISDFTPHGEITMVSSSAKMKNESIAAVALRFSNGRESDFTYVYGNKGMEGQPQQVHLGNMHIAVAYGARRVKLPFSIRLRDFIMDRYPGTNSASSYASEVTLMDPRTNLAQL
jgi:hypothetical protein